MSVFVLVHGAFADVNAWGAVRPLLENAGHRVVAINLPGHGDDTTPVSEISLQTYIDAVAQAVESSSEKVTLVGHSMAGIVVSGVAEKIPERLDRLVYVAAYLPQNGQSLQELAQQDPESLVGQNMEFAPDYSTVTIKKERLIDAIAADLTPDLQKIILESQRPEPLRPFADTITLTPDRFGSIPKYYIETTADHAVTNTLQKKMIAANDSVRNVYSLPTSHLPFLAQPEALTRLLLEIVTSGPALEMA